MDSSIKNLRDTIIPKSDQLNADDLMGVNKIITITNVRRMRDPQQPVAVHYEGDDGRPYKPSLSMRRVLIFAWGDDGNNWVGKHMELYRDPSVKYGGKEVGGIKICSLSDIPSPIEMMITERRGQRAKHRVNVLQPVEMQPYPEDRFNEAFEAMEGFIQSGKMTTEQVITRCERTGKLSDEQRQRIRECAPEEDVTQPAHNAQFNQQTGEIYHEQ